MKAPLTITLMMLVMLSGCIDETDRFYEFDPDQYYTNPGVYIGKYEGSVLNAGTLDASPPEVVRLESARPAYGGAVESGEARVDIVMAIWRPENVTEPVPVIVDAGPYFEVGCRVALPPGQPCPPGQELTISVPSQTTPFNLANYLPHGYAVVQLGVRGTGTSGGCMDLLGPDEAHDLDQAITWLGEQAWSNGRIAMVGASYDGSTQWEVAGLGNPYLKTIVPTSGLPDIYDLMFHNGSAEFRGPIMHNRVYWGYGFDSHFPQRPDGYPAEGPWPDPIGIGQANGRQEYQDRQNLLCPEVVEASAMGQYTAINGDRGDEFSTYWVERDWRQRVLDNYEGSVFLIHGLQDWNVDPHAAIPFNQQLRDAGIPMKEWYGQWDHAYPDSRCAGDAPGWAVLPCRLDFAEVQFRWFEHHLKQNTTLPLGPEIQVQDNVGFWRNADSYPPRDPDWLELHLTGAGTLSDGPGEPTTETLPPPQDGAPGKYLQFVSEPFDETVHISGLPQLKLPFDVEGQGGHISAWLFDMDPDGEVRAKFVGAIQHPDDPNRTLWQTFGTPAIGYSQMNLRYYAGGEDPQPLVPGQRYEAQIEFEPLEVRIPAGNRIALWVFQHSYEDKQDSQTPAQVNVHLDEDAVLRLSTIEVDPRDVFPVPGAHFLNHTYVPEMYVPMPSVPTNVLTQVAYGQIPTLDEILAWQAETRTAATPDRGVSEPVGASVKVEVL